MRLVYGHTVHSATSILPSVMSLLSSAVPVFDKKRAQAASGFFDPCRLASLLLPAILESEALTDSLARWAERTVLELRAPELPDRGPSLGEGLAGALGDQVALDLGEQREEGGHDFGLDVALALNVDVLLHRHEGDACRGEGVKDGDDLTRRPADPGEFADDLTVAALENVHQLVESAALLGSLSRGGRLDEIVDAEVVFACVLEDGEARAAQVLLRGRDPQIGNGFHGLAMEYGFWYFI